MHVLELSTKWPKKYFSPLLEYLARDERGVDEIVEKYKGEYILQRALVLYESEIGEQIGDWQNILDGQVGSDKPVSEGYGRKDLEGSPQVQSFADLLLAIPQDGRAFERWEVHPRDVEL